MPATAVQNFKSVSILLAVQWPKNQTKPMASLLETILDTSNCYRYVKTNDIFLGIQRENWIPKTGMF